MKNKRRWLAGLLAVILIMNTFVGSALAKNEDGVSTQSATEQEVQTKENADATETATEAEKTTAEESSTKSTEEKKEQDVTTEEKKETATTEKKEKNNVQKKDVQIFSNEEKRIAIQNDITDDAFKDMFSKVFGESMTTSNYKIVYVADEAPANSSSDKGTQLNPYTSISDAYQQTDSSANMIVVLRCNYEIEGTEYKGYSGNDLTKGWLDSSLKRNAIITAENRSNNGAYLKMTDDWYMTGNTGFYDIKVSLSYKEKECHKIFCSGYTCVFGGIKKNNFVIDRGTNNNVRYPVLFGGSDKQDVDNTDVYIYGGRYNRIYTGGVGKYTVKNIASVCIDGTSEGKQNIAVSLDYPNAPETETLYGQGTVGLFNGGAWDRPNNVKNTLNKTNLEISNFDMGYHLYDTYGTIKDTAVCKMKNSKIGIVQSSDTYGSLVVDIKNCEVSSLTDGNNQDNEKKVSVTVEDSTITNILEYSLVDNFDKTPYTYKLTNSKFRQFVFDYNVSADLTMDNCTQIPDENGRYYAVRYSCWAKLTLKNMGQKILFTTDTTKLSSNDQMIITLPVHSTNTAETRPLLITDIYYGEMSLINTRASYDEDELSIQPKKINSLNMSEDSVISIPSECSVAIGKYKGEGTIKLGNKSAINIASIDEDSRINLDSNGKITDRISVGLQNVNDNTQFINACEGISDLYSTKQKTGKTINYIYSTAKIDYDSTQYIYVDATNKDDEIQDGTQEHPAATLEKAYTLVTQTRHIIVLLTDYEINFSSNRYVFPSLNEEDADIQVTICSKDSLMDYSGSASIIFKDKGADTNVYIGSNITFENITFKRDENPTGNYLRIRANGYALKIGENVSTATRMMVCGAGSINNQNLVSKVDLQVYSGTWDYIDPLGGNVGDSNAVSDNVISKVVIGGNTSYNSFGISGGTCYGKAEYQINENKSTTQTGVNIYGTYKNDLTVRISGTRKANTTLMTGYTCEKVGKINVGDSAEDDIPLGTVVINSGQVKNAQSNQMIFGQGCRMSEFIVRVDWTTTEPKGLVKLIVDNKSLKKIQLTTNKASFDVNDTFWKYVDLSVKNTNGEKQYVSIDNRGNLNSLTIGNNISASLGEDLKVENLEVKEDGVLRSAGKLEIGEENYDCVTMGNNSNLEVYKELIINGNIAGPDATDNKATLKLQKEPKELPETISDDPDGYSAVKGKITGQWNLDTDLLYDEATRTGQILYVSKDQSEKFNLSKNITKSKLSETDRWDVLLFGKAEKNAEYVYVSGTGNNQNDGFTADNPVKTLSTAYERVADKGTIIICGDLTLEEWPTNALKTTHITSYREDTQENYTQTAKLILTNTKYYIYGATYFECIHMDIEAKNAVSIDSPGLPISFGLPKEKMPEDSSVKNFYSTGYFNSLNIAGSYLETHNNFDITINSGNFGTVIGSNEIIAKKTADQSIGQITVTGGNISTLRPISTYKGGMAKIKLSDAKINSITGIISTANADPDSKVIYDVTNCEIGTLYAFDQWAYNGEGQEIFNFKDCEKLGTLQLGAISPRTETNVKYKINVTVNIENSTVSAIQCGRNGAPELNDTGELQINLNRDATVKELYLNNITNTISSAFKKRTVSINDNSVVLENIMQRGINSTCSTELAQVEKTHILINTGSEYAGLNKILGQIPNLDIGTEEKPSSISIDKSLATKIDNLSIAAKSIAYLQNGVVFTGNYNASDDQNEPSYLLLKNGSLTEFKGAVHGYTNIKTGIPSDSGTEEFAGMKYKPHILKNGLRIKGGSKKGDTEFYVDDGGEKLLEDETKVEWYVNDTEDTNQRNCVYVSSDGNDSAAGGYGTPVQTLAQAYKTAGKLYSKIKNDGDLEDNLKEELLDTVKIYVMDQIELGDFTDTTELADLQSDGKTINVCSPDDVMQQGIIELSNEYSEFEIPMDTKFDNVQFSSTCVNKTPRIFANGYNVTFGSQVTGKNDEKTIHVYGGAKTTDVDQTNLVVNGGSWDVVCGGGYNSCVSDKVKLNLGDNATAKEVYGGGYLQGAEVNKDINVSITGGEYDTVVGAGLNAPTKGTIEVNFASGTINSLYGGGPQTTATSGDVTVKIGTSAKGEAYLKSTLLAGGQRPVLDNVTVEVGENAKIGSETHNVTAFCAGGYAGTIKNTVIKISGGTFYGNIYGGGNGETNSEAYGKVTSSKIYMDGGSVYGNIYGGGYNGLTESAQILINDGIIKGDVYGGGNAAAVKATTITVKNGKVETVFGGSYNVSREQRQIQETSEINLKGGFINSVFGGSNLSGSISNMVTIVIPKDNTVTNVKTIYGGGNQADLLGKTKINVEGDYNGDIFAGGKGELKTKNRLGRALLRIFTESDLIDANVSETNVNVTGTVTGDIFAGGEYATVGTTDESADKTELSKEVAKVTIAGKVNGKVYGGGKGEKDKNYAAINGSTNVTLTKGGNVTVSGHAEDAKTGVIFGGGQNAPVAGNTNVNVKDGTYSTIFGGNDVSGEIKGNINVNITGAKTEHAYGAGRDAKYDGTGANVIVNDETSQTEDSKPTVSEVYGGGYGEGAETNKADVSIQNGTVTTAYAGGNAASTEDTKISITGGQTDTVFGGGNAATITGSSKVTVNTTDDTQHVDTIFAGNNKASMAIKPRLDFKSGKIGTVYCGGNQGIMTYKSDANSGISYDFDYPDTEITTVFAGCNNTTETTSDVKLTLISGTYGTVYGGNNQNGTMNHTSVVTDASKDTSKALMLDTIYGGGNQADAVNTSVTMKNGTVKTVYAGGNSATVTQSAKVNTNGQTSDDNVKITDLYSGNNEAEMAVNPLIDLAKAEITNFYGGGNKGAMTDPDGLDYTFNSDDLTMHTIYGGGNEAGVTKSVTLNVEKGNYTDIYGGSNSKGTVDTANVNIKGNVGTTDTNGKVFGGGRGNSTVVNNTNVSLQNGTITGNVYGGSGFGSVDTAKVSAEELTGGEVKVIGNIYGAGYGVSSSANDTQVDINLKLTIKNDTTGDVKIDEVLKSNTDKSGESKATATWNKDYKEGSYISGNVFGGGDMGQVGKGYINTSTNTAVIENGGKTTVNVGSGYIHGNIFGGGNGQPGGKDESGNAITEYTAYMGTVFGSSNVNMTGGYVNGNVFGCGQQSRTYASTDTNNDNQKDASFVNITTDNQNPILIGGSIFGGGNKGNGTTQNASVATVYGDTHVELKGVENQYTQIYLLSNGTNGGGVYGDGNLCLVSGKKYVTLENFSCGVGTNVNLLKTFYSLQRADVVDIIASRIVLKGAVDLVAENADDTVYSINRASQVNLKKSSTIKVTKTVNLLGELTSDEQTGRQFIDRGNNNGNANISGNDYTGHNGSDPEKPLQPAEVTNYITAYNHYADTGNTSGTYNSINVVCVANGGYLEVKKSASEYGPVTGLFTLQLVNANPGEGGGFIYADIMGKHINNKYVTGNFVCVTKQTETSNDYMYAYHNVGGQFENGKYEYYVWYLKGNKYSYDVDLTSYIGTKDTEFTKTVSLATEPENYCMILTQLNQTKDLNGIDLNKMYQNTWSSGDDTSEKFAVEVTLITKSKSDSTVKTSNQSIGYIGYQTESDTNPKAAAKKDSDGKLIWGIWRSDGNGGWKFQKCKGTDNSFAVSTDDALATTDSNVVNAQLKFTLHKGTGMTTEFRNLPFEMKIAEAKQSDYESAVNNGSHIQEDSCIRLTTNLNLSAIRLVPTQAAYMGSGRMFAGVSSNSNVNITKTSAFTAQFVTKYIPSAFNTGASNQIEETLTTNYSDTYLLDENGVGYTVKDNEDGTVKVLNVVNSSNPNVKTYKVTKSGDAYEVSYLDENGAVLTEDGKAMTYSCKVKKQSSGFTLPKGTMITLLASLDEQNPTYWYYYCTKDTTDVELKDFKKMNTSNTSTSQSSASVYDTIYTTSSSRVTENMIFVFDFEEVSDSDWENVSKLEGNIQLKHTYNSSYNSVDIMDYVSTDSETSGGTTTISYNREMPRQTDTFKISPDSDGITRFNVENADQNSTYGQKDQMKFRLDITPDTNVTNTQYEEREYAVILKLKDKNGEEMAFPEGTVFYYKGKRLATGKDNKYVIVPVATVGSHEVEIESKLKGFDPSNYELTAALYSTSEDGYYNSIQIEKNANDKTSADFTIKADPVYALKVTENSASDRKKNHFASAGESFKFEVTAKGGEADDTVSIGLYRYSDGKYKKVILSTILEDNAELKTGTMSWNPKVKEKASTGTYRLEFVYHDKTEYWDFMVR